MSWFDNLHSANWNQASIICLCSYLLGCFAAGYYLVRMRLGEDIRELGSGSVGARNVGRVLGKTGFLLTLMFDFSKGAFAVWAARHFTTPPDDRLIALAMVSVIAGHIWPLQLRFRGGKGMATSLGAMAIYDPYLALTFVILFFCAFVLLWRTVLPGLFAFACLPLACLLLDHSPAKVILVSLSAGLVLLAHRKNFMEEILHVADRRDIHPHIDQP
jgi:glycerol-3-phosphate acyltransferase PlsY